MNHSFYDFLKGQIWLLDLLEYTTEYLLTAILQWTNPRD